MTTPNLFNGSTLGFTPSGGSNIALTGPVTDFKYDNSPSEADASGAGATQQTVNVGRSKETVSISFKGPPATTMVLKAKGAMAVNLNDGSTDGTLSDCIITKLSCSGRMDEAIESSVTIRPTASGE